MNNLRLKNGKELSKEKIREELNNCGININSKREFVLWYHKTHGIVFDTIGDYRRINGTRDNIDDLDLIVPFYFK